MGSKVALAVLSTLTPGELANAIALQDKTSISRAPGVGPKVAVRIVTELKNKAPAFAGEMAPSIGLKQEPAKALPQRRLRTRSRRSPISAIRETRRPTPLRLR